MSQGRERGPRRAPFQVGLGQVSSSAGPVQGQHKGGNRNMQLEVGSGQVLQQLSHQVQLRWQFQLV